MSKPKVIILLGPTAVGKTSLSIDIAKAFNFDVISGDAYQIYKDMDIGTGKITESEMDGVTHHMLDIKSPDEEYSVKEYQEDVRALIDREHQMGKTPFIVGGTGLYIKSLIYDYRFSDENKHEKEQLEKSLEKHSNETLYNMLIERYPDVKDKVHPNNRRRVMRTLIKYEFEEFSDNNDFSNTLKYDILIIGLTCDRSQLYERINTRVEHMFEAGLLEEVTLLHKNYTLSKTAHAAIGYKEFDAYFNNQQSLEETIAVIQQNSRNYAKRQLTFFNNQLPVKWYSIENLNFDELKKEIQQFL